MNGVIENLNEIELKDQGFSYGGHCKTKDMMGNYYWKWICPECETDVKIKDGKSKCPECGTETRKIVTAIIKEKVTVQETIISVEG